MGSDTERFNLLDLESVVFDIQSPIHRRLESILKETGCFTITDHGVDEILLNSVSAETLQFFRLPSETKAAACLKNRGKGYYPLGRERLAASMGKNGPPDLRESFNLSSTPENDFLPDELARSRHMLIQLQRELRIVFRRLCHVMSNMLRVDEDFFHSSDPAAQSILRINYCPSFSGPNMGGADRVSEHTDFGTLSIIWSKCSCSGLEVQMPDGSWSSPPCSSSDLVVVVGDLLQRWTNGKWRAAIHRVANIDQASKEERLSVVYLGGPSLDSIIRPIDHLGDPKFEPIRAKDYIQMKSRSCRFG